jgi:hypothetical protein
VYNGTRTPLRNCPRSPDLQPAADRLGVSLSDAANYTAALARWTAAGWPTRTEAEVARIFAEHCQVCGNLVEGRCIVCRCRVSAVGLAIGNKVAMETEHCPENRW